MPNTSSSPRRISLQGSELDSRRNSLLSEIGKKLPSGLLDQKTLLDIAESIVLVLADVSAIAVFDADGNPGSMTVASADPERADISQELQRKHPADASRPAGILRISS